MSEMSGTPFAVYAVAGMTCERCMVSARRKLREVARIAGLGRRPGTLGLIVSRSADPGAVAVLALEAGYEVVP